jgi:hypothetical protein
VGRAAGRDREWELRDCPAGQSRILLLAIDKYVKAWYDEGRHEMEIIQEYLTQMAKLQREMGHWNGYVFCGIEDFLLREGRLFGEPVKRVRRGKMKQCFMNAYHLARTNSNLHYCEGVAAGIIPVMHAWCVDKNGQVHDPTWPFDPTDQYWGVSFDLKYVDRVLVEKKTWGVLDNYEQRHPLLRGADYKPHDDGE